MAHPVLRYALHMLALLVLGPIAFYLASNLRDSVGSNAATLFYNSTPMHAAVFGVFTLVAASAVGLAGARMFSTGTGLTAAGFVLAWAGWGLGTIDAIARATNGRIPFVVLAIEGLVSVGFAAALTLVCTRIGTAGTQHRVWCLPMETDGLSGRPMDVLLAAGSATGGAAAAAYFFASSDSHGQTLAAAFFAGCAAGVIAQLVLASRKLHAQPVLAVLAVGLVALAGPIVGQVLSGNRVLVDVFAGRLNPLSLPIGLVWAAGTLIGVPVGLGWAGHAIDRRTFSEPGLVTATAD